jgi:hypothetical protein
MPACPAIVLHGQGKALLPRQFARSRRRRITSRTKRTGPGPCGGRRPAGESAPARGVCPQPRSAARRYGPGLAGGAALATTATSTRSQSPLTNGDAHGTRALAEVMKLPQVPAILSLLGERNAEVGRAYPCGPGMKRSDRRARV